MPEAASAPDSAPMLAVRDLNSWYGESHVLHGVSFDVRRGEVVTLLGRMEREGSHYGLATMCVGVGQGTAMIIEGVR